MRHRSRESDLLSDQLELGSTFVDTKSPGGDGPWRLMSTFMFPSAYALPLARDIEECLDELHPGPPWKSGGPFDKWRLLTDYPVLTPSYDLISGWWRYAGKFCMLPDPRDYLEHSSLSSAMAADWRDASSYGPQAWNRFRPGKPEANLMQFLVEIREVPRMLMTTARLFARLWRKMGGRRRQFKPDGVANHWLNTQFGWRPFIRDLIDFWDLAGLEVFIKKHRFEELAMN